MLVNTHKLKTTFLLLIIGAMISPLQAEEWSLQQCIDTAQVKNKMLQISQNSVAIGEQRHKEAVAGLIMLMGCPLHWQKIRLPNGKTVWLG